MLTTLTLAVTASLLLSAQASAQETKQPPTAPPRKQPPTAPPRKLNAICKDQALAWSASWVAPFSGAQLERGA
jgi:hypothetical protein